MWCIVWLESCYEEHYGLIQWGGFLGVGTVSGFVFVGVEGNVPVLVLDSTPPPGGAQHKVVVTQY